MIDNTYPQRYHFITIVDETMKRRMDGERVPRAENVRP